MRIEHDPMQCENCGELTHDDLEKVENVPRLDPETYEVEGDATEVYVCGGCHAIVGVK
jgi:hypothetical protein